MTDDRERLGASGVFQAIVDGARKLTRAVTGGDREVPPEAHELGEEIGRAFVSGRFGDVHALGTPAFQQRTTRAELETSWRDATSEHQPMTGYAVTEAGEIDLGFIPGLEDVPQEQFVAFLQLTFSSPQIPLHDERALVIGAVLIAHEGRPRLGALHAQ